MRNTLTLTILVLFSITVIFGGLFFGLFSCGGYEWHKQLHMILMTSSAIFLAIFPPKFILSYWKRATFLLLSIALFVLIRSAASAFYPASPENMAEFIQSFIKGIEYGPC